MTRWDVTLVALFLIAALLAAKTFYELKKEIDE